MALKLSIFLPKESIDNIDYLEEFITSIGDLVAQTYGNDIPVTEFDLENLNSFIIIRNEELPKFENFEHEDMFLVIPIRTENE